MIHLKALSGTFEKLPGLHLHILLTEEDGIVVARCLDFSVSSHGKNEEDALLSLSDSIQDYLDYAIQQGDLTKIIDPEEENFWKVFRELELQNEIRHLHANIDILKIDGIPEVSYA